jgi:hypothetical protein
MSPCYMGNTFTIYGYGAWSQLDLQKSGPAPRRKQRLLKVEEIALVLFMLRDSDSPVTTGTT